MTPSKKKELATRAALGPRLPRSKRAEHRPTTPSANGHRNGTPLFRTPWKDFL